MFRYLLPTKLWYLIVYIIIFFYGIYFFLDYQSTRNLPMGQNNLVKKRGRVKIPPPSQLTTLKATLEKVAPGSTNMTHHTSANGLVNGIDPDTSYHKLRLTSVTDNVTTISEGLNPGTLNYYGHRDHMTARRSDNMIDPNLFAIYNLLPHLKKLGSLQPRWMAGVVGPRTAVDFVIGVPSAKRESANYLKQTLRSLIMALNADDKIRVLIVVYLAGSDVGYVETETKSLLDTFPHEIRSGLMEIIAPPQEFYPDLSDLTPTLGDSPERMKWRTRQVLDMVYLFTYAYGKGSYYLQLEDDIISKNNFLAIINQVLDQLEGEKVKKSWDMLDFCRLGFIGKLFRNSDLPTIAIFFTLFYKEKPVDWLLQNFFETKYCSPEKKPHCEKTIERHVIIYEPQLFQHVGTKSSLSGKIQKLKVENFENFLFLEPHQNPPATVSTSLDTYSKYSLEGAYARKSIFWAHEPRRGDVILIEFHPPVRISNYRFKSCHEDHLSDCLYNTTVEIRPKYFESKPKGASHVIDLRQVSKLISPAVFKESMMEGFVPLQYFDHMGSTEGVIPSQFDLLLSIRLKIHSPSQFWVAVSEIFIQPQSSHQPMANNDSK